jgi:hypothetical protein
MDNYLRIFSEELDAAFNSETFFPDKKIFIKDWLKRKFIMRKRRKSLGKNSTIKSTLEINYAQMDIKIGS